MSKSTGPKKRAECVVVAIIRNKHGFVLMTERTRDPMAGMWHLPGGAVEFGENHLLTLVREVKEELGVEVRVTDTRPVAVCSTLYPDADRHVVSLYFFAEIVSGKPQALDGTNAWGYVNDTLARLLLEQGKLLDSCRRALSESLGWKLPLP